MRIAKSYLDEIVAHALEDRPNECCGMVSGSGDTATEVFRAFNELASPMSFNIEPNDLHRIYTTIEDRGEDLLAIYHSHTKSPAEPSQQDRNQAKLWPDPVWLICSLADPENPVVRGWDMRDGKVVEVELELD
ncbi:MAG: M67 family metallopeptidase [Actinomycetota bacterium]|nr:M67 family metallopeptidase [Actinomycetota bacterium]